MKLLEMLNIVKEIIGKELDFDWSRIRSKNCYYSKWIECNGEMYRLLKSYNTVVGIQNNYNGFWELGKYSRTTSKQVTEFVNDNALDRYFVEVSSFDKSNTLKVFS